MGRGGIEPPTPGFSIDVSLAPKSALTGHHQTSYANTSDGPITEAQQIAQQYRQETAEIDPDLGQLIEAWNTLDGDAREAVLGIINAMKRG